MRICKWTWSALSRPHENSSPRRFKRVHFVVEAVAPMPTSPSVQAVRSYEETIMQKRDELRAFEEVYRKVSCTREMVE